MKSAARLGLVLVAIAGLDAAPEQGTPAAAARDRTSFTPYAEARPIVDRLAPELAAALAAHPDADRDSAWLAWAARRDADIRARLERGDEDSLINLLLFGTSFTSLPRALNDRSRLGGAPRAEAILHGRIADLVGAIAVPGANGRLQFARDLVARRGIDPTTAAGMEQARTYLTALMARTAGEAETYARTLDVGRAQGRGELAVRSTLFRARGLSSDTSIRPDFAIDGTLEAVRGQGVLAAGSVRRVAVIGPGLDFTDKAEGYDFYPEQSTQPFSVIDSLVRLRLSQADRLTLTTIDLNPRVNRHLRAARVRAADGVGYVYLRPRDRAAGWAPGLDRFWTTAGGRIGTDTRALRAPAGVDVRAVRVRPDVVLSVRVADLNIVVERLDPLPESERFDLVIATNVLVYYDVFDQSLALANIAAMLRPGGLLLSNNVLVELPATPMRSIGHTDAIYSRGADDRDQIVWYQRQ